MRRTPNRGAAALCAIASIVGLRLMATAAARPSESATPPAAFNVEEATISEIQRSLLARQISTVDVVNSYLTRIKAYNGVCVDQPQGELGPITPKAHAGQINALGTLNLRPAARTQWGFDARKARSLTDRADADPSMPDALEVAAMQDKKLAETGRLAGPLHGVVFSIKDQFDTFDMRTTNGADVGYANDRPPDDATFIGRLRQAGAIILAKANRGGSQPRSAFGGIVCNPYDTERTPRASSSGSGASVSANLVTCSIGEETGISIRGPASANNVVGIAPTQELISRDGMNGPGLNVRMGPICRTVEDAARVLTVVAGWDPKDPLSAFSVGRTPEKPYEAFAQAGPLQGVRIGVIREYMNKSLFTKMDEANIDVVETAIGDLKGLGATIVDPGPEGELFQGCIDKQVPYAFNKLFTSRFPDMFPVDAQGKPTADHVKLLLDMADDPKLVPKGYSIRDFGSGAAIGDGQYLRARYLRDRKDARIKTSEEMAAATKPINDPEFTASTSNVNPGGRGGGANADAQEVDMSDRLMQRFAVQQVLMECMAELRLDALTYPTMNVPPLKIQAPEETPVNGRNVYHWTVLGQHGFPAMSVPAGFTTAVYDRVRDSSAPGGTKLVGPTPARLPVGIDFAGRPFSEPLLIRIAAAYTAATHHRSPPPEFGPLP
jgi:amidase